MSRTGTFHVGTSGWSYASWRTRFYPAHMPPREWLRYYAAQLDCVEVNSSFYRLPLRKTVRAWAGMVPERFRFSFKLWKAITHEKRLLDCAAEIAGFAESLEPAKGLLGPLLVQLPPGMAQDTARLDLALGQLQETHLGEIPIALEFRHRSWYQHETYAVLRNHGAVMVVHDMPPAACGEPLGSGPVYVRFHGPAGDYGGSYRGEVLRGYAERMRQWLAVGRDVTAFFNNDKDGHALGNLRMLKRLAGG